MAYIDLSGYDIAENFYDSNIPALTEDDVDFDSSEFYSDYILYVGAGRFEGFFIEYYGSRFFSDKPVVTDVNLFSDYGRAHIAGADIRLDNVDPTSVESFARELTKGDDYIKGTLKGDTLFGGSGSDRIFGNGGADNITGNTGADYITGDTGDDILRGAQDNDTLIGGWGNDYIAGGIGSNIINAGEMSDYVTIAVDRAIDPSSAGRGNANADFVHLNHTTRLQLVGTDRSKVAFDYVNSGWVKQLLGIDDDLYWFKESHATVGIRVGDTYEVFVQGASPETLSNNTIATDFYGIVVG